MTLLRCLGGRTRGARARTPRRTVSLERLEERHLPSGLAFQFLLDDPGHQFDAFPLLSTDLNAVGQILSGVLAGQGTIQVSVRPDNSIPRSDGSTVGVFYAGSRNGVAIYDSAALAEARTGVNPNGSGPEVVLEFNAQAYLPTVWFDPSGAARTAALPAGRIDFISLALHEMMHGFGFQGYRTISGPTFGGLPAGYESSFDALTSFGAGGLLYFLGPHATAVYGGPVPLTTAGPSAPLSSQNFYHVGNPAGQPGANLLGDLMNGVMFSYGTRYTVSALDLAVLADLGWSVPGFPATALPLAPPAPAPPGQLHRKRHPHPRAHPRQPPQLGRRPRPIQMHLRLA